MPLPHSIQELRDRTVEELSAPRDYYTDSKIAWESMHRLGKGGFSIKVTNRSTGSAITHKELSAKARGYAKQVRESNFQQLVSAFEIFVLDLMRLWLTEFPASLGRRTSISRPFCNAPTRTRSPSLWWTAR